MNNIKTKLTQSSNQRVVLLQLILIAGVFLNWFTSCSNSSKIGRINKQQVIGVQLANGDVVSAKTDKITHRENETIRTYLQKLVQLSFNWNTDDVWVEIESTQSKLPGNAYASTFAFTSRQDFRQLYTKELSQLITKATKNKPNIQSAVRINYISQKPVQIKPGIWEAVIVSDWIGMDMASGKELFSIPFNKKIRLQATPIGAKTGFISTEQTTQLQSIIDETANYGLTVIALENYDPE